MKLKRTLAAVLCLAMIATSGIIADPVGATELGDQNEAVITEDQSVPAAEDAQQESFNKVSEDESEETDSPIAEEAEELIVVEDTEETSKEQTDGTSDEFLEKPDIPTAAFSVVGGVLTFDPSKWVENDSVLIDLPAGNTRIPVGIFNTDTYNGTPGRYDLSMVKDVFFTGSGTSVTIDDGAFYCNKTISNVDSTRVVTVGNSAFYNCSSLNGFDLKNVITIGNDAFSSSALIEADLTSADSIGNRAFSSCSSLSNVTWGDGITSIGDSAFSGCKFSTLKIDHLYDLDENGIGNSAFSGNSNLTNITLPYHLKEIPQSAFSNCPQLNAVNFSTINRSGNTVDNELEVVAPKAFEDCKALKEISFGKNVIYVGSLAFSGCKALVTVIFAEKNGAVEIDTTAFPDRSSEKVKGVIKGRGGKVKEFTEKIADMGWKYQDLDLYKIKITNPKGGTITSNVASAGEGEKVYLTATPSSGNTFTSIMVNGVPLVAQPDKDLYSSSTSKQVYLIRMPNNDIEVTAVTEKTSEIFKGNDLTWTFSPNSYGGTNSEFLKFTEAGNAVKINVFNKLNGNKIDIWNFKMTTNDASVATISQFGEISALKKGSASILLEPTVSGAKKISINVSVASNATIESLDFDDYFKKVIDEEITIEDARVIDKEDTDINTTGYYIVEFDVESIAKSEHSFTPELTATDENGNQLLVNSKWESKNTKIATVASATSSLNENKITVNKGTLGETFIRVTTINDDDGTLVEGGFIVRVLDTAPRLIPDSVQVNVKSGGAPLLTEPVYGYTITSYSLRVCTKKTVNGVVTYPDNTGGFNARYDRDRGQIILSVTNVSSKYKAKTETVVKGLYVEGTQKREGSTDPVTFHMPLKKIIVINDSIEPNIEYSGKINLLYDETYEKASSNVVTVYLGVENVKNLEIEKVDFVTEDNYKKSRTAVPADDEFASNFEVDYSQPVTNKSGFSTGFVVKTRDGITDDAQFKKNRDGDIIRSGYAKVKFYSYSDTLDFKIKVPCAYTFPNYSLSAKKATASVYFKDPAYLVQIIDNDSKYKRGVELYTTQDGKRVPKAVVMSNHKGASGTTPSGFYNTPVLDHSEPALDSKDEYVYDEITGKQIFNDYIKLSGNGTPREGKEVFYFRLPGWRTSTTFTFNMAVSNSRVSGKLIPSTLTMNKNIKTQSSKMEFSLNFKEAKAKGCTYDYKYAAKTADAYEELKNAFEFVEETKNEKGRVIPAHIKVDLTNCELDDIPKGTYTFTAKPTVSVGDYDVQASELPTITFKISITNSKTTLSLTKSKFVLNTNYSGNGEIASVGTKVSGIAKGATYVLNEDALDGIHLMAASKKIPDDWSGDIPEYGDDKKTIEDWTDGNWRDKIKFSVCEDADKNKVMLGVELDESVPDSEFNYDYYIYGLPFKVGDDELVQDKVKIRITGHRKFETVSLSSKDKINQIITGKFSPVNEKVIVPGYEMVYSYSIKNLFGNIDEVSLQEIDSRTNDYYDGESPHFYIPDDGIDNDKKTITIRLNPDNIMGSDDEEIAPLKTGKPHIVDVYYHIKECGDEWAMTPCTITIVPKQVLPTLKQVGKSKTIYAGGLDTSFEFEVGKTTCQNAVFADVPPEDVVDTVGVKEYVKIADSAKEDIRKAFRVVEIDKDIEIREWNSRTKAFTGPYIYDKNKDKILGAKIRVQLVQPSYLVAGKTYTIPIEIRYENQDVDTKGNIVEYEVTIVK